MKRRNRLLGCSALVAIVVLIVLSFSDALAVDVWKRENPLVNPIAVTNVRDGVLTLADGRSLRPAGVVRRADVSPVDYDRALKVMTAQGVVITRDFGDGASLFLVEPKFYNWCGTCGRKRGGLWTYWAGTYFQCPMSMLLTYTEYAEIDPRQTGLTALEQWRIEGASHLALLLGEPTRISDDRMALRYDGTVGGLSDSDGLIEANWKPPPSP